MKKLLIAMVLVSCITMAQGAIYIAPGSITATTSSEATAWGAGFAAQATVDGVGLDIPTLTHATVADNYYHSFNDYAGSGTAASGNECEQWIQYEFDAVYDLSQALVWNGAMNVWNRTTKDVVVSHSLDGTSWTSLPAIVFTNIDLLEMNGRGFTDVIDLTGISAKYIELALVSQYDSTGGHGAADGYYLMDEVLFELVPEPATMVLLSLGGLFLRRKK